MQIDVPPSTQSFDFQLRTRMIFEVGGLTRLGQIAQEYGSRALVVSDPGIVAAGHTPRGIDSLRQAGLEVSLFDGARENPTTENVEEGLRVAREFQPDLIIGLGGGSSMDCAKGINFLYCCGGSMKDYWGVGKATADLLPMIAVPTTAGTGSEMQSFALISDAETHVKMACGDKRATCKVAILDPELTLTQPEYVTALTGIDAISHALETFVTVKRNPISSCFSRESWKLLARNFRAVLNDPENLEARGAMQMGAALAGLAIENSMLGASHALANPLTAVYDTPHGQAVGLMLPHVIRFNGEQFGHLYSELLAQIKPVNQNGDDDDQNTSELADFVQDLVSGAGLSVRLSDLKVDSDRLAHLAEDASKQWTGNFNPRPVDAESLLALYQRAY